MRALLICALLLPFLASCAGGPQGVEGDEELMTLGHWMSGSFSSAEQAAADTSYFDIRLERVRIWPERQDAYWLYAEQAVATRLQIPHRQRVYRLSRISADTLESAVFELPDPAPFVGAWGRPADFGVLSPDSLDEREGCAVKLVREDAGTFVGRTDDGTCSSRLRGANYATFEVTVREDVVVSWDRGFNEAGEQVWGATQAGYIFRKIAP